MRAEFAKVLYVVAYDHVEGKESDARGPQAGHGLTKAQILEELGRHFPGEPALERSLIDKACTLLLTQNYFELKGGKSGKRYLLHEVLTVPTLILDRIDAKIVLLISDLVDMEDHFALDYTIDKCATELGVNEEEVKRRIDARSQTINGIKGYFVQGQTGSYELNSKTVEEERPYLEMVAKLGFKVPRQGGNQVTRPPARRTELRRSAANKTKMALTRSRGHLPKGVYDVQHGQQRWSPPAASVQ